MRLEETNGEVFEFPDPTGALVTKAGWIGICGCELETALASP